MANSKYLLLIVLLGVFSNHVNCSQTEGQKQLQIFLTLVTKNGLEPVEGLEKYLKERRKNGNSTGLERDEEVCNYYELTSKLISNLVDLNSIKSAERMPYCFVQIVRDSVLAHRAKFGSGLYAIGDQEEDLMLQESRKFASMLFVAYKTGSQDADWRPWVKS